MTGSYTFTVARVMPGEADLRQRIVLREVPGTFGWKGPVLAEGDKLALTPDGKIERVAG
jgi:hypothetical protein